MPLFVFPKKFEFYKFLYYININYNIKYFTKNDYYYKIKISTKIFYCLVVDDSDIGFTFKLMNFIKHNKEIIKYNKVILIGSCGSNIFNDLGKMFEIKEATKGDRGYLSSSKLFEYRLDKKLISNCNTTNSKFKIREIVSTNFLNENCIHDIFKNKLFDMETYDFFQICSALDVQSYHCFRFVTDYVCNLESVCLKDLNIDDNEDPIENNDYIEYYKNKIMEIFSQIYSDDKKIENRKRVLDSYDQINKIKKYARLKMPFGNHWFDIIDIFMPEINNDLLRMSPENSEESKSLDEVEEHLTYLKNYVFEKMKKN
jgi:hypothetical protein